MLTVLLETNAAPQRRSGSAVLSTVVHSVIIGGIAVGAAVPSRPVAPPPDVVSRPLYVTPRVVPRNPLHASGSTGVLGAALPVIRAPLLVPRVLPPVIPNALPITDPSDVVIGSGDHPGYVPRGILDADADSAGGGAQWTGSEALMHIRATASPTYPESLRRAGVSGRVVLRFVVDSTGRVDVASVQVVESTHDAFTRAVRDVLPRLRFEASRVNGRAVRALAEMPFEFVLR